MVYILDTDTLAYSGYYSIKLYTLDVEGSRGYFNYNFVIYFIHFSHSKISSKNFKEVTSIDLASWSSEFYTLFIILD